MARQRLSDLFIFAGQVQTGGNKPRPYENQSQTVIFLCRGGGYPRPLFLALPRAAAPRNWQARVGNWHGR